MIVTCVHVYVKPENIQDFIEVTKKNHEGTIKEPGNVRFDFVQSVDDPSRFMLYEVFKTQADVEHHKTTAHYLLWRDAVGGWMAKNREGIKYSIVAPEEINHWQYPKK